MSPSPLFSKQPDLISSWLTSLQLIIRAETQPCIHPSASKSSPLHMVVNSYFWMCVQGPPHACFSLPFHIHFLYDKNTFYLCALLVLFFCLEGTSLPFLVFKRLPIAQSHAQISIFLKNPFRILQTFWTNLTFLCVLIACSKYFSYSPYILTPSLAHGRCLVMFVELWITYLCTCLINYGSSETMVLLTLGTFP